MPIVVDDSKDTKKPSTFLPRAFVGSEQGFYDARPWRVRGRCHRACSLTGS